MTMTSQLNLIEKTSFDVQILVQQPNDPKCNKQDDTKSWFPVLNNLARDAKSL